MPASWYYLVIVAAALALIVGAVVLNEILVARDARRFREEMLSSHDKGDALLMSITEMVDHEGRAKARRSA